MGESSASYIHTVQHLIEKCLLYRMNKEECMEALNKHANIKPVITSTVWAELEKENRDFFAAYAKEKEEREMQKAAMQRLQQKSTDAEDDDGN
ncbi:uncharacterized protein LOC114579953 [Dendrobium catenatum]|uniref:uncharacterized protein LOC114579953 n=1 Tax=Dendrobium catenatum TaxID=906689 RepID=UPI0010A07EFA|nr:uncharacterized protein LOC114579953 [Dendrobium catenatum]